MSDGSVSLADMTSLVTRRSFLGGLLTLAVMPSLHAQNTGLTPLEIAVENVRRAYLCRLLDGQPGIWPLAHAIRRHRELGLPGRERILTLRLALRLAQRDYRIIHPASPGITPRPFPPELRVVVEQCVQRMMERPA